MVSRIWSVMLAAALGLGSAGPAAAQFEAGIPVGSKAPTVVINDLEGRPVELASVIGKKPVLLEFWATWCSLCKELLPQLEALRSRYGDRLAMVGVNVTVNDSKSRVRRYLAEHKPAFQVLYDDRGAGARAFDVPGTSFIVVLDRHGTVVYTGSGDRQDLGAAVAKAFQVP
jgi:thiol-disulfide isomerase/thioredoxin